MIAETASARESRRQAPIEERTPPVTVPPQGEVTVLRILFRLQSNRDGPGRDGIGGPHLRSENPLCP